MKKRIENPKVFISYAWGDDDYQNTVIAFASQLVNDGIDVVLDKWDLSEGNDTYAFMEKCVTDTSITNVLILLDPTYAKKADEHAGGVGTETQIISAQVYEEVTQDKFVPVIMKRDENGNICKPTYLQGRLHFDLSLAENYDQTYCRLVRTLFGIETYVKPELGNKPIWVDTPIEVAHKTVVIFDSLKNSSTQSAKSELLISYLSQFRERIVLFAKENDLSSLDFDKYIQKYDSFEDIRNDFLQLMKNVSNVDKGSKRVSEFFEDTYNSVSSINNLTGEIVRVRLHEMFLYVVAGYLKNKDFISAGYFLEKTYYNTREYRDGNIGNFRMFYSGSEHSNLDLAIKTRDGKKYYTGTGQHWIETLNTEFCTKEQLIFADLVCFNISIYGDVEKGNWPWFPILYVYDNEYGSKLIEFSKRLVSKEFAEEVLPLFGLMSADELKNKFKEIENLPRGTYSDIRYRDSFDSAPTFGDYINSDKIASAR